MCGPEHTGSQAQGSDGWFKTTHWSVVLAAKHGDAQAVEGALSQLCQAYWYPLYTFVQRSGHNPEEAKDLTQGFFLQFLAKDYLKGTHPEKGRFRSFLLVALKRYLANEWDWAHRQKRGGGKQFISLDETEIEANCRGELADHWTPEQAFDQRWASVLLARVNQRLASEALASGREQVFEALRGFLTGEKDKSAYPEVAHTLGMNEGTVRVNVHRLRQRYRELLRLEVAETVERPEDIDEEIRHLFSAKPAL